MDPAKITRPCPRCGTETDWDRHWLTLKLVNSTPDDPITLGEGILGIVLTAWEQEVGRKYHCPNCGKKWRSQ